MVLVWISLLISFGYYSFGILLDYGYLSFFPPIPKPVTYSFPRSMYLWYYCYFLDVRSQKKTNKSITPVIITAIAFPFLGSQALLGYMIYDWFTQKEKPSQRGLSAR